MDHPDSILLIEDAEKVITDREQTASSGVSNILNITDGILSDLLKMQIVATFNMDKDNIDKALLRKGRLIAEYEFGKLSVEKSNNKLKELGKDYVTNVPLTLTEIYNIDDMDFGENVKKVKPSIGFS
jgi:SpoVK/Ycf46/Vps4 family AAA+-type ATPase